jgi:hypothetical protein
MQRLAFAVMLTAVLWGAWERVGPIASAAPAAPSYVGVEKAIESIREGWARPGARQEPNAPGWNVLFDSLLGDLRQYSQAQHPVDRLTPLNRIYQISSALGTVDFAFAWPGRNAGSTKRYKIYLPRVMPRSRPTVNAGSISSPTILAKLSPSTTRPPR